MGLWVHQNSNLSLRFYSLDLYWRHQGFIFPLMPSELVTRPIFIIIIIIIIMMIIIITVIIIKKSTATTIIMIKIKQRII